MNRREFDQERYEKLYDMVELMYILNRLSNNSYVDDRTKGYLIGMLENVESIKSNFDKYRYDEPYQKNVKASNYKYNVGYSNNSDSFLDKIIFFLKSLND